MTTTSLWMSRKIGTKEVLCKAEVTFDLFITCRSIIKSLSNKTRERLGRNNEQPIHGEFNALRLPLDLDPL